MSHWLVAEPAQAWSDGSRAPASRRLLAFPVRLIPSTLDLPAGVGATQLRDALEDAARAWSYPQVPCTSAVFAVVPAEPRRLVARDGAFRVLFRTRAWCHNERCGHLRTYPSRAAAMTTLFPETLSPSSEPIQEADIELNGLNFSWTWQSDAGVSRKLAAPLRPALVHELGHVLGLNDACLGAHGDAPEVEHCNDYEADSVMLLRSDRTAPTSRDVRWLCTAYPQDSAHSATASPQPTRGTPNASRSVLWASWIACGLIVLGWSMCLYARVRTESGASSGLATKKFDA